MDISKTSPEPVHNPSPTPEELELVGVGMQLDFRKKNIYAIKPLPGGPAAQAGIIHGDALLEINGELLATLSQEQVISRIRGPRGTQVTVRLLRKGETEPRTIVVTRERIQIQNTPSMPSVPNVPKEPVLEIPKDPIPEIPKEQKVSEKLSSIGGSLSEEEKSRLPKPKLNLRELETTEKKTPELDLSSLLKKNPNPTEAPFSLLHEPPTTDSNKKSEKLSLHKEISEDQDAPQKKTNRIHKKTTERIKKKTQKLLKVLFEEESETSPVTDKNTISDPIIEIVPIEKGKATQKFSPNALESSTPTSSEQGTSSISNLENQLNQLQQEEFREIEDEEEEEEIPTVSPQEEAPKIVEEKESTSRLKKATQRLKKASQRLKRVFKSFDEHLDEEKKEAGDTKFISLSNKAKLFPLSPETQKSIHAVLEKLPQDEKPLPSPLSETTKEESTSRLKKATQRLKKAADSLKGNTNRIVKSMIEHLEEEEKDSADTRYISINEVKQALKTEENPPENVSKRLKKMSERLKKKSQKLIKIFYEEPEPIKKEVEKKEEEIGASYWYSLEDSKKLNQQKRKKIVVAQIAPGPVSQAPSPTSFTGWNDLGMKNTGPDSEKVFYKFAIGIASFFLFLWSIDMIPTERKTYGSPTTNTVVAQAKTQQIRPEVKPDPKLSKDPRNSHSKGTSRTDIDILEEEPLEEHPVFEIYFKNLSPEETLLKQLLEQHQLTFLQVDKLPSNIQNSVTEKELLFVLMDYQQKIAFFDWAKKEIKNYENFDFKNTSKVLSRRDSFLLPKNKPHVGLVFLLMLATKDFRFLAHQELSQILALSGDKRAYEGVLYLYEREAVVEKRMHLLLPLTTLGQKQTIPLLLKLLESQNPKEVDAARRCFLELAIPTNENDLKALGQHKNNDIALLAQEALSQIKATLLETSKKESESKEEPSKEESESKEEPSKEESESKEETPSKNETKEK